MSKLAVTSAALVLSLVVYVQPAIAGECLSKMSTIALDTKRSRWDDKKASVLETYNNEMPLMEDVVLGASDGGHVLTAVSKREHQDNLTARPDHWFELEARKDGDELNVTKLTVKRTYRQGSDVSGGWALFLDYINMTEALSEANGLQPANFVRQDGTTQLILLDTENAPLVVRLNKFYRLEDITEESVVEVTRAD